MPFTLYDATVANFQQGLAALDAILSRAPAHFAQQGTPLGEIVEARLAPDMLPFSFQVVSAAHHSMGALNAARDGLFKPPVPPPGVDFAGLQALAASLDGAFGAAVQMILSARGRVIVSGMGKSGHIARKIAATRSRTSGEASSNPLHSRDSR